MFVLIVNIGVFGQNTSFDNLTANYSTNKSITWFTSNYGSGFGHRILNSDPGGQTLLNFQGRHNSANWSDILTLTSNGNVGIGTTNPQEKLEINGGLRVSNPTTNKSWRLIPNVDNSFSIKETGFNGAFNISGDGGVNVNLMNLKYGKVGIGTTTPQAKLHVSEGVKLRKTAIGMTIASGDNSWIRDEWLTGSYGAPVWNSTTKKWVRPSGTYNDIGGIVYQDEGTYFLREKPGSKLEFTNSEFLNTAYMFVHMFTGNIGIGTTTPDAKLAVNGNIHTKEIKVDLTNWPDYVFEDAYTLPTLQEVADHIATKGHLINIPSAAEVEENGIQLGEMNAKLLEKIEELTLYTIAQEKEIKELQKVKAKNSELEARLAKIEALLLDRK